MLSWWMELALVGMCVACACALELHVSREEAGGGEIA